MASLFTGQALMTAEGGNHITSPVLVTGCTGMLCRLVVPARRRSWCPSPQPNQRGPVAGVEFVVGDLATGDGVDEALAGVATVVHCAGTPKRDVALTRTLVGAAARAHVRHLINVSVVGADRVPVVSRVDRALFGYYASKRGAEQVLASSGVPWTTLRATQFHDLVLMVARALTKLPVVPVFTGVQVQPIDTDDVAARLVELAGQGPAGLVPDLAGPRQYGMDEMIRSYLHATGRRRPILPVRLPGRAARAVRDGALLAPDRAVGHRTWEEFLADRLAGPTVRVGA